MSKALQNPLRSHYTADEAIGVTVNDLMFRNKVTRKALGEALGITSQGMSRKILGQVGWSIEELYKAAEFFNLNVTDLLPRRVPLPQAYEETPQSSSEDRGVVVAGAGFEPTTSGL